MNEDGNRARVAVWVLSHGQSANQNVYEQVRGQLSDEAQSSTEILRTALQTPDGHRSAEDLARHPRLHGVVLVLERAGLTDERYASWVKHCVSRAANKDDFRVFVALHDLSIFEINALADSEEAGADAAVVRDVLDVLDGIQRSPEIEQNPGVAVAEFIKDFDDIRDAAARRSMWKAFSLAAGYSALILQLLALAASTALGAWVWVSAASTSVFRDIPQSLSALIAIVAGLNVFPALACLLAATSEAPENGRDGPIGISRWRCCILTFVMAVPVLALQFALLAASRYSTSWFAVGAVAGVMLDVVRRRAIAVRAQEQSIDFTAITRKFPLPQSVSAGLEGIRPLPLWSQIMSETEPRVFISYTHRSDWSKQVASELHAACREKDIYCFLDEWEIPRGSSWRSALNREIGHCNVFVSLLAEETWKKPWPAAELEAALSHAHQVGYPEVIVLIKAKPRADDNVDHPSSVGGERLPVFEAVVTQRGRMGLKLKEIGNKKDEQQNAIRNLVRRIEPGRFRSTQATFGRPLEEGLRLLGVLPLSIMLLVGSWGTIAGWLAMVLVVFQAVGWVEVADLLRFHGALAPALLLCGFWAGFVGRLAAASRFEVAWDDRLPKHRASLHAIMALFFIQVTVPWLPMVPAIVVAWGAIACGLGWFSGANFVAQILRAKRGIRRPA